MIRDFVLGFIKIHVLHHASQEPIYGLAMMQELQRHGYEMSPGTLYPILHGLEKGGFLVRHDRVVGGKIRKYYEITEDGRAALEEARVKMREMAGEVLEGKGPVSLPEPAEGPETDQERDLHTA